MTNNADPTLNHTLRIAMGDLVAPSQPVRPVNSPNLQTQVQLLRTAGVGANPPVFSPNGPATAPSASQGVPQNVTITSVSRLTLANGQRRISVSFRRNPSDPNFQAVAIYLKQGNGQPSLLTQSTTSPATFTVPASTAASAIVVQSVGNFGFVPAQNSPARTVNLS
jgi:hypothetical protein